MSLERSRGNPDSDRRLLGELLVEAGVTSRTGLAAGLRAQQMHGGCLGFNLMKVGSVVPAAFHFFLQDHLEVLVPDLAETLRVAPAIDLIPPHLAHHYGMVPVRVQDRVLALAVSTADIAPLLPAVQELTGLRVDPVIAPPSFIGRVLARFYPAEMEKGILKTSGECLLVLSDGRRDVRPLLPEMVREDAPAADWLRALLAEGIRQGARRLRIEPESDRARVGFEGAIVGGTSVDLPAGAAPGVLSLVAGLAGIVARGRVAPREGRLSIAIGGRRIRISVLSMPGLQGDSCRIDLRAERVAEAAAEDLAEDLPDLLPALLDWSASRRGLVILAAPGAAEQAAGLAALCHLLGDRLPTRLACGAPTAAPGLESLAAAPADEETEPLEALVGRALARNPDLVILPESSHPRALATAALLGGDRPIVAPFPAVDAFEAAELFARREGRRGWGAPPLIGFLGVRLMEKLCRACARPFDLHELLAPWPVHRRPFPGDYLTSQGCDGCRGSGQIALEPVFEFVPGAWLGVAAREPARAANLRAAAAREGRSTLFRAGLRRAARGLVDVKEPLRLLLHELG